jgi:hypothetical protein
MLKTLLVAALAAATRAPQNNSIRQEDLRADLFVLDQASWEIANADLRQNSR